MKKLFINLSILFGITLPINAGMIEYSYTTPEYSINYIESYQVPKFNSTLGKLDKIEFILTGNFKGASRTENLSNSPVTITLKNSVRFKQTILNNYDIFDEILTRTDIFNALSWDGSFPPDWQGNSGHQFLFDNYVTQTFILENSDTGSLALFTGTGDILLSVQAHDVSSTSMSGPNIVASQFENAKSIISTIRYHYTPVPESKVFGYVGIFFCVLLIFIRKLINK